jgi:hypothetical protein
MARSMLDKSKLMNTQMPPQMILLKQYSSNITTIGLLDREMRSCSVNNIQRQIGDTKLMLTKYNFEEIDEALHSESKGTTYNQILNDRDESHLNMFEKEKWTKKRILENTSFETTQYDIYNPEWDSCDLNSENDSEISILKEQDKLAGNFLSNYEISLKDVRSKKKISPIHIKKRTKNKFEREHATLNPSFLSRNYSQNTNEKDGSSAVKRKRTSKFIVSSKKKKLRITKKRKQPYNYANIHHVNASKLEEDHGLRRALNENYYSKNDSIFSAERLILASSSKNERIKFETPTIDFSTIDTGRIKNSYSKADTQLRSCASIIITEESDHTIGVSKRNLSNTPIGKARSSSHFKRIVNSYSSKKDLKQSQNIIPWTSNLKTLPKRFSSYSCANSRSSLAHAYKAMPKESILTKRTTGSRRWLNAKKGNRIPPAFRDSVKDNETLSLLLKHLKNDQSSKLPTVASSSNLRTVTHFADSHKNLRRKVCWTSI